MSNFSNMLSEASGVAGQAPEAPMSPTGIIPLVIDTDVNTWTPETDLHPPIHPRMDIRTNETDRHPHANEF